MNIIPEDEMLNDLATADAAGDTELANAIASRIKQQRAQAQPAEQVQPDLVSVNAPLDSSAILYKASQPKFTSALTGRQVTEGTSETLNPYAREQTLRGMAQTARVAPAMAAGVLTGGVCMIPSMLAIGGASAIGETGAQAIEQYAGQRQGFSGGEIGAAGIAGLAPTAGPAMGFVKSAAINVPSQAIFSELARFSKEGQDNYALPSSIGDFAKNLAAPIGLSAIGTSVASAGHNLSAYNKVKKSIISSREGGTAMLGEVMPDWTKGEAIQLAKGNPRTIAAYNGALEKISSGIIEDLSKYADGDLAKSVTNAIVTENITTPKQIEELFARNNLTKEKFGSQAKLDAMKKMSLEYGQKAITGKIFAGGIPEIDDVATTGVSASKAIESKNIAGDSARTVIGDLYDKSGIGENTPVLSKDAAVKRLSNITADDDRVAMAQTIQKVFGQDDTISLSRYRKVRDEIVADLVNSGSDISTAKRIAGQKFSVLKDASDDFVSSTQPPESFRDFSDANNKFKSLIDAESSKAIDMIEDGDVNGIYSKVLNEGVSNEMKLGKGYNPNVSTYDGLMKYADTIGGIAGSDAANQFKQSVNKVIRDGVFRKSMHDLPSGRVSANNLYDPEKLVNEVAKLERSGIPIGQLGLGTSKDIRDMAKAMSVGKPNGFTADDASEFLKIVSRGDDYNKYKSVYNDLQRTFLQKNGSPSPEEINKVLGRHKGAGLSQTALSDALNKANSNPLTQLLKTPSEGGTGAYGLNVNDLTKNTKFSESLMEMSESDVKSFVKAMKDSGKADGVHVLGKTAAANALMLFEEFGTTAKPAIKAGKIAETFFGDNVNSIKLRNNLKALMGPDDYNKMMDRFVNPSAGFVGQTQKMLGLFKDNSVTFKGLASIKGLATGNTTGGTLVANALGNSLALTRQVGYNTMYDLMLGKYSDAYAKAGYNLSKFASASPVNATIVKLGIMARENAERERLVEAQKSPQ